MKYHKGFVNDNIVAMPRRVIAQADGPLDWHTDATLDFKPAREAFVSLSRTRRHVSLLLHMDDTARMANNTITLAESTAHGQWSPTKAAFLSILLHTEYDRD